MGKILFWLVTENVYGTDCCLPKIKGQLQDFCFTAFGYKMVFADNWHAHGNISIFFSTLHKDPSAVYNFWPLTDGQLAPISLKLYDQFSTISNSVQYATHKSSNTLLYEAE